MKDTDDKMKILFLCHGNICRSPMAEFVMKELVRRAGRGDIESAKKHLANAEKSFNIGCLLYIALIVVTIIVVVCVKK